jgi:hypothetical protein
MEGPTPKKTKKKKHPRGRTTKGTSSSQQVCALFMTNYKLNMVELNLLDFNPNSIEENQNAN